MNANKKLVEKIEELEVILKNQNPMTETNVHDFYTFEVHVTAKMAERSKRIYANRFPKTIWLRKYFFAACSQKEAVEQFELFLKGNCVDYDLKYVARD